MNSVPPVEMLDLEHLRGVLAQMRLVEYVFSCNRIPYAEYLPPPPSREDSHRFERGSAMEKDAIKLALKRIVDCYRSCVFMLGDSRANENEQWRFAQHAAFVHMQNFLPKYTWRDVVRMKKPENMSHGDYLILINNCSGKYDSAEEECLFIGEENMDAFCAYISKRKK